MATYKGVKGFTIQSLSADPPTPIAGQVWYNSTSQVLKGYANVTGAWSAGGNLNTARRGIMGIGSQTAALGCGGVLMTNIVEAYNGSTWTEVADLGTARYMGAPSGTQTA